MYGVCQAHKRNDSMLTSISKRSGHSAWPYLYPKPHLTRNISMNPDVKVLFIKLQAHTPPRISKKGS